MNGACGYGTSLLLGVLQGLTEFLPVSSSGHLVLVQRWLRLDAGSPQMLLFDVLAHVGTLAAVLVVFRHSVRRFVRRLALEMESADETPKLAWRFLGLGILGFVPSAVAGLTLQRGFEAGFDSPKVVAAGLFLTGVLLMGTRGRGGKKGWKSIRAWEALLIGLAQAAAILPGISRSGATIGAGLYCGWRPRWAAEFSFLIAVPAIVGAALVKLWDTVRLPADQLDAIAWGPVLTGAVVSFVVGWGALRALLAVLRRTRLHLFAPYCWLAAVAALLTA